MTKTSRPEYFFGPWMVEPTLGQLFSTVWRMTVLNRTTHIIFSRTVLHTSGWGVEQVNALLEQTKASRACIETRTGTSVMGESELLAALWQAQAAYMPNYHPQFCFGTPVSDITYTRPRITMLCPWNVEVATNM